MDRIQFKINGTQYFVGCDVESNVTLLDFIRQRANLLGTKYMCLEAGCGACIVSVIKTPGTAPVAVNACMVIILSCHNWEITTIEKVGNKLDGYHPIQKALANYNGTQCGHCSPGWVMAMYSLLQSRKKLTMLDIEKSFGSNICRCTGYRSILDAFKSFAIDAPKSEEINDIEDLHICKKDGSLCNTNCRANKDHDDWCVITKCDVINETYHDASMKVLKDSKIWYRVKEINDIFDILEKQGDDSYMLVAGNTAKGVYPIDEYPRVLIDISDVDELKGYRIDQNLIIRAGTTLTELLYILQKLSETEVYFGYLKILFEHLTLVAHIAVRNLGTIAGNLVIKNQHNEFPSDIYLLLATVDARVTIIGRRNMKQILTMEEFLKTDLKGKVILNVILPPYNNDYKFVTYKIMPRFESAQTIVNAGFCYKYTNRDVKVIKSRIVYGGLSPSFTRARSAENYLAGKVLFSNETLQRALTILEAELLVQENPSEASVAYRKRLALGLFYKGLLSLSPTDRVDSRYRSGAIKLNLTRPISKAQQDIETKPSLYPLTEPIPKLEGLIQCSGEASYTDDQAICTKDVFAALVLSNVPTGKIVSIDPSNALRQPGALAFYSAKDIPGLNSFTPIIEGFTSINEEVFSSGEIKYFNQPIGVVAAETKYIAKKIAKMVNVTYANVKKPIVDIREAKKYQQRNRLFDKKDATDSGNNISKTIRGSVTIQGQSHFTMENVVCISRPTEEGLEIFATTQWIDILQESVSKALNIDQNRIDVSVRRVGGAFGLKITRSNLPAVACSLVSWKLNKPCRLVMPLTDTTRAFGKRFPCSADYDLAIDSKGTIQYLNLNVYEDNGFDINETIQVTAVESYNNCYSGSRWNYKNISTITDTAKNTYFRAPGHFESVAVIENIMERISYELSLDPIEVRSANLDPSTSSDMLEIISTLKKSSQYNERKIEVLKFNRENRWKKRGLGTCLLRWSNPKSRNFDVNMSVFHGDGSIVITIGGIEIGQGINTKVTQVCAYLLKIPIEKIQIKPNTSTISPNCSLTAGSLTTQFAYIGVRLCCIELLKRLDPIRDQLNNPNWEQLIQKAFEMNVDLQIHAYVGTDIKRDYYLFGMTVAEVEVDILTGERQILRVDILEDLGQSTNPKIDLGQIEGAFVQGLGYWLTEKLVYDTNSGELLTNRTWNYHVPLARDIPQDFRVSFRKNAYTYDDIFGSKGTSEPPICMAVSIPHAIRQALSSARLDCGIPATTWFNINGPYSLESVCLAAGTKNTDYLFR